MVFISFSINCDLHDLQWVLTAACILKPHICLAFLADDNCFTVFMAVVKHLTSSLNININMCSYNYIKMTVNQFDRKKGLVSVQCLNAETFPFLHFDFL